MTDPIVFVLTLLVVAAAVTPRVPGKDRQGETPGAPREIAVLETNLGRIEIELYRSDAPKTVENFVGLAGKKYYDGVSFHRIAKGFVIQGGDPTGTGAGGESLWGKPFRDELNPAAPSYRAGYRKGVVAMANRGPNTNTSQFFILLEDAPQLPRNYTIFGIVVQGMDVVEAIGRQDVTGPRAPFEGRPVNPVLIRSARVRIDSTGHTAGSGSPGR